MSSPASRPVFAHRPPRLGPVFRPRLVATLAGLVALMVWGLGPALADSGTQALGERSDPLATTGIDRVVRGNLVLEDIPETPSRIVDRLERYLAIRSASFEGWHPGGEGILVSTRFGETGQIHWVREPGGARHQLTFYDEPVTDALPTPPGSEPGFLFPRDVGGSEFFQIFHFDLSTGEVRQLTDGASRNGSPRWSRDGSRLAYYTTRRNGSDWDIHVQNLEALRPTDETSTSAARGADLDVAVLEAEGAWVPIDWAPDGKRLLVSRQVSIHENHPHILDLETGALEPLATHTTKVAHGKALFSHQGDAIFYTSDEDSEFKRLRRRDLATGETSVVGLSIDWDVEDFVLSPDGRWLAVSINEGGASRLQLISAASGEPRGLPDLPAGLIRGLAWSPDGEQLGFQLQTPRTPGDVFSVDVDSGELVRWTRSEVGGLPTEEFVEPTVVHYPTFDTVDGAPRQIPALYYRPEGEGPFPVVVQIHGGPEGQSRPSFRSELQYWVRELGIAVLLPNVRGSAGYGKSYLELDNGFKREDSVRDIGKLLDWIAVQEELDADRVAVRGGSYGGYMVLASMIHFNDRLRAGIDVVGISNFVTFLENTQDYRRDLRRVEYGDERDPEMRAHLEAISPTRRAAEIQRPIFVAQGLNDPRVPASESAQMVEVIRENGGQVWYLLANDEGHGFRKKGNRDVFRAAVIHFLETFLLG